MEITVAVLEDIPALAALLGELFAQEAEFAPDTPRAESGLRQIIANPEAGIVLVAKEAGTAVGIANVLFTVSTALGGRVAILDDFVVAAAARGRGIGSALLERAIVVAREQGCLRIALQTDHDNVEAQRLYQRHGFALSTMLPMRLILD